MNKHPEPRGVDSHDRDRPIHGHPATGDHRRDQVGPQPQWSPCDPFGRSNRWRRTTAASTSWRFQITTRAEFERLSRTDPVTLTDLERAARFLYLQRVAFGGRVDKRTFGVSPANPGRFDVTKLAPLLEDVHERLSGVIIECLAWPDFLDRYDRPETLFYLDPPYWGSERDYGAGVFPRDDFALLAARLRTLHGPFILSLNDVPEVRALFAGFSLETVETTYAISSGRAAKRSPELLISAPRQTP